MHTTYPVSRGVKVVDAISTGLGVVSGLCILVASALIIAEIFVRDVFGNSLLVSDEYTGYLMAASSFLGLAYVEKTHGHIRMDLVLAFENKLPTLFKALRVLCYLVAIGFAMYLLYVSCYILEQSINYSTRSMQYSETLLAIPQAVLPIGALALCAQYLCNLYKLLYGGATEGGA